MDERDEVFQVPQTNVEPKDQCERRLLKVIKDKLAKVEFTESFTIEKRKAEVCIYKVPEKLREVKKDAYSPRVVAIGPFHQQNENTTLAPMSQHKLSYMISFLAQGSSGNEIATERLERCIAHINGSKLLDEAIRHCYRENIPPEIGPLELAEMMLVDGCFILELFLRAHLKFDYMPKCQFESDPVLRSPWTMAAIRHDLALLENQIPFFILQILYDIIRPFVKERNCKAPKSVTSLALSFFKPMSRKEINLKAPDIESKHLLDLLYKFYFSPVADTSVLSTNNGNDIESNTNTLNREQNAPDVERKWGFSHCASELTIILKREQNARPANRKWGFTHCASELLVSGIEFRSGSNTEDSLLNITFDQPPADGVISIPQLHIHDTTSISLFRNLVAFEQCSLGSSQRVTSYVFLMKSLISSSVDSKLLERREIIQHSSNGEKEYLANKFRSILDGVDLMDDFYFRTLCDDVKKHQKSWNNCPRRVKVFIQKQCRILRANYLSSAWKVMSILAALAILLLTSLQTYFTIYPRK